MKKQATKLLESLVAAGLTPEQAEYSVHKAIADGTCEDDRAEVKKAINEDDFNAALEKIAKAVERKDDIVKSVAAEAEKAASKVDAAVAGEKVNSELSDVRADVKVAIEKAQRSTEMLETALPGFRDMFVVVAGAIENLSKSIAARLDAIESIQKSATPVRHSAPAPRSMQVAGRVAPAPGDSKASEKDPVILRKSIFDKIRAETASPTTTPKRHGDLAKGSAVLTSMTTIDALSQLATELGYSDLVG